MRGFVVAMVAVIALAGCGRTPPMPVVSPDGSMEAAPDTTGELAVVIKRKGGPLLYRWETGVCTHQRWSVEWKDEHTLLLSSSDIGAYTLKRLPDESWQESTPGGVFSPDGKWKVQTSWQSGKAKRLKVLFGEVTGHRSYAVRGEFLTDLVVADPFNCARWDGNARVVVKTTDGEHSWARLPDGGWVRED